MSTEPGGGTKQHVKYPINGKGLIVIVRQINHNLLYRGEDWTGRDLNYEADEKRIFKLFQIKKSKNVFGRIVEYITQNKTAKADAIIGRDLLKGECKDSFFHFMNKVKNYKEHKPSFVLFFLMSHGLENGEFLLAAKGKGIVNGKMQPEGPCCYAKTETDEHDLEGECYGRDVVKDIIQEVGTAYPDIPKMFVLQCCRGGTTAVVKRGDADPPSTVSTKSKVDLFIPESKDSLVLRACIEGSTCWVPWEEDVVGLEGTQGGSLLIQSFCRTLEELQLANQKYDLLQKKLKGSQSCETSKLVGQLRNSREDVIGGWMMNVCQRTTAFVTNYLYVKLGLSPTPLGSLVGYSESYVKASFLSSLERQKTDSRNENKIDRLLDVCNCKKLKKKDGRLSAMVKYFLFNIFEHSAYFPLEEGVFGRSKREVKKALDCLIAEIREKADQIPYDKQQPHTSSSLSMKLSCLDMMQHS